MKYFYINTFPALKYWLWLPVNSPIQTAEEKILKKGNKLLQHINNFLPIILFIYSFLVEALQLGLG